MATQHAHAPHHDPDEHPMPVEHTHHPNYVRIYVILLLLLGVSIIGPEFGIRWVTLVTAFGIAIWKAYLVAKNFMHLNFAPRYVGYLVATTLLFSSGGHLLIVKGFATSYVGLPVGGDVPTDQIGAVLLTAFSMMFLAALQIAGPMVAVLLLADVALALLSRAAPALNIFTFGFPLKIMLTLVMLGLTFPLLPPALDALMEHAVRAMVSLKSG